MSVQKYTRERCYAFLCYSFKLGIRNNGSTRFIKTRDLKCIVTFRICGFEIYAASSQPLKPKRRVIFVERKFKLAPYIYYSHTATVKINGNISIIDLMSDFKLFSKDRL